MTASIKKQIGLVTDFVLAITSHVSIDTFLSELSDIEWKMPYGNSKIRWNFM